MTLEFEWDPIKALTNIGKHGISFELAAAVFRDSNALSIPDLDHSTSREHRWITIGLDRNANLLVVVHTFARQSAEQALIRIISARPATRQEARDYEEQAV